MGWGSGGGNVLSYEDIFVSAKKFLNMKLNF